MLDRNGARSVCLPPYVDYGFPEQRLDINAYAAVDMALWDLCAKAVGAPLYELLGGPVRARAPFVAYAYTVDLEEGYAEEQVPNLMAELALRAVAESGASIFETKIGVHSLNCDVATVRCVSDALGPRARVALDANMAYDLEQARIFLKELADEATDRGL